MKNFKKAQRAKRHARIRAVISGTAQRPRLVVFRSLKKNYAQLVDDSTGKVLTFANDASVKQGTKTSRAHTVGVELAKKALEKGIKACVFDRNGYKYHGRVSALASGAREGGLKF